MSLLFHISSTPQYRRKQVLKMTQKPDNKRGTHWFYWVTALTTQWKAEIQRILLICRFLLYHYFNVAIHSYLENILNFSEFAVTPTWSLLTNIWVSVLNSNNSTKTDLFNKWKTIALTVYCQYQIIMSKLINSITQQLDMHFPQYVARKSVRISVLV